MENFIAISLLAVSLRMVFSPHLRGLVCVCVCVCVGMGVGIGVGMDSVMLVSESCMSSVVFVMFRSSVTRMISFLQYLSVARFSC